MANIDDEVPTPTLEDKLMTLLIPDSVRDSLAREGTKLLEGRLSGPQLVKIARRLVLDREPAEKIAEEFTDIENKKALAAALRRIGMRSVIYKDELKEKWLPATKEEMLPLFGEDSYTFEEVLRSCKQYSQEVDPMEDLLMLVEVQKRKYLRQLREWASTKFSFMNSKVLDSSIDCYRNLLKTLLELQMELGMIGKAPKQIDLRMQGAFQTYTQDFDETAKARMAQIGKKLIEVVSEEQQDTSDETDS